MNPAGRRSRKVFYRSSQTEEIKEDDREVFWGDKVSISGIEKMAPDRFNILVDRNLKTIDLNKEGTEENTVLANLKVKEAGTVVLSILEGLV